MIATSGFLAALECTKFVFVQGSAPHSAVDPTSKVKGGKGRRDERERPPNENSWIRSYIIFFHIYFISC